MQALWWGGGHGNRAYGAGLLHRIADEGGLEGGSLFGWEKQAGLDVPGDRGLRHDEEAGQEASSPDRPAPLLWAL